MNFENNEKYKFFKWVQWTITGTILCLVFDNIPKFLQLTTISSGFAGKFSWYFLFILMVIWLYQRYLGNFSIGNKDKQYIRYIFFVMVLLIFSNICGLINYPYYNELLSGPSNQIEKLPTVLTLLHNNGILIDEKHLTMAWIGVRALKGAIFYVTYTLGFSYILYYFFKRDWNYYFNLITKIVIASVILLCIYSGIELFYLAGFDFAKNILSIINPMIHPIAVDHGWWPPLLWEGQLRSVFSEPSRMGNYLAFGMPFLWGKFLLSEKKSIKLILLITFYTFMIFMTRARTAVSMYWGILFLLFLGVVVIHRKEFVKKFLSLCIVTILSLGFSILFINVTMSNTSMDQGMTIASYMEDNVKSLGSSTQRSNGARYALILANIKTGLNHPILGVGNVLSSAYTVHNFKNTDLLNGEVCKWVNNYNKEGVLRYGLDAMNEYVSRFAENGILGLVALAFPFFYVLWGLFKYFRIAEKDEQLKVMIVAISLIGSAVAGCNGSLTLLYAYWVILAFSYAVIDGNCKKKMSGLK